jgi:hypothetical protein
MKVSRRDGLQCRQIHLKLLELYGDDALSYSEACYWSRQGLMDREDVEGARRTGRSTDFSVQPRIQSKLQEIPFASVRCIAEDMHAPATTVIYSSTEVFGLKSRHWGWVLQLLLDDQKLTGHDNHFYFWPTWRLRRNEGG